MIGREDVEEGESVEGEREEGEGVEGEREEGDVEERDLVYYCDPQLMVVRLSTPVDLRSRKGENQDIKLVAWWYPKPPECTHSISIILFV